MQPTTLTYKQAWQAAQDAWEIAGCTIPCHDPDYLEARKALQTFLNDGRKMKVIKEAESVEGRIADLMDAAYTVVLIDLYRLSENDKAKVIAALRSQAMVK